MHNDTGCYQSASCNDGPKVVTISIGRETWGNSQVTLMCSWVNLKEINLLFGLCLVELFSDLDIAALKCYLHVWNVCWLGKKPECTPDINAGGVIYFETAPSKSLSDFSVLPKRPCQQQTKLKSQGSGRENLESNRARLIYWLWHLLSVWPWACQLTSPRLFSQLQNESWDYLSCKMVGSFKCDSSLHPTIIYWAPTHVPGCGLIGVGDEAE